MQEDKIPKIFISYSWSRDDIVLPLAERLVSHGVEVVLDKWELKDGQDKYAFMEQCVTDPNIDRVLIICDKLYTEKANNREGGVGDETVIISPEMYGHEKQEKFIPIVAEHDENDEPYLPAYLKTRIYIDLSNDTEFEVGYEKLLRNIYEKPLFKKPKLGSKPEWLEDETNYFLIRDLIKQIKGAFNKRKQEILIQKFIAQYIENMKQYYNKNIKDAREVFNKFIETKVIRDVFLDFLDVIIELDIEIGDLLCNIFETFYNTLIYTKTYSNSSSCKDYEFDVYKCYIWELFICTVTFLRYYKEYGILNCILSNTYFLRFTPLDDELTAANYSKFRHYSRIIEEYYKPTTEKKNKYTLLGDVICHEREKKPIYTTETLAQADLFLHQVFNALNLKVNERYYFYNSRWFPTCYIYTEEGVTEWIKMKSKRYCEKMFVLFGVSNVSDLKQAIANCATNKDIRYSDCYYTAPSILSCIKLEEIGSMN